MQPCRHQAERAGGDTGAPALDAVGAEQRDMRAVLQSGRRHRRLHAADQRQGAGIAE